MSVTSPATELRARVKAVIDAEFAPEGIVAIGDNLHESMGESRTVVGIAPEREGMLEDNELVQVTEAVVKFYTRYKLETDPTQRVDPSRIEEYAERFRRAMRTASNPRSEYVWYMTVTEIQYPDDPTGNKSRFEAGVRATGNNSALVETTG